MKKSLLFCIVLGFSINLYAQWGSNPSLNHLGSITSEQQWLESCNSWKRTIRGMTGQIPPAADKVAVQMLIDYVQASAGINNMEIEVFDVWAIVFPSYVVIVWFTNYEQEKLSYKSINFLLY